MDGKERISRLTPAQLELLRRRMAERRGDVPAAMAVPRVPRDRCGYPLAFEQERFWFLHRLDPGGGQLNTAQAVALRGELRTAALVAALGRVCSRHEGLRTAFVEVDGRPEQRIVPSVAPKVAVADLSGLGAHAAVEVERRIRGLALAPFDPERAPVLRVVLLRRAAADHVLVLVTHHLVADRASVVLLAVELMATYAALLEGRAPALPPLPVQPVDFACWQRGEFADEALERQLEYWTGRLAGSSPYLDLPTDMPRPSVQRHRGATRSITMPAARLASLRAFCHDRDMTPFMALFTACAAALGRWAGADDVLLGSPVANRSRPELRPMIGYLVNNLVLRLDLAGDPTLGELLGRAREVVLESQDHPDLPLDKLIEALRPERDPAYNPLFQVLFLYQNLEVPELELPRLEVELLAVDPGVAQFDLIFEMIEAGGAVEGRLTWNRELFEPSTVDLFWSFFLAILDRLEAKPEARLSALAPPPELSQRAASARLRDRRQTVAVAATFTADLLEEVLGFWFERLDVPAGVVLAPFNQLFQQLLDPESLMARNPGVNLLLARFEDWLPRLDASAAELEAQLERHAGDLVAGVAGMVGSGSETGPCLLVLCPPSPAAVAEPERRRLLARAEARVVHELGGVRGVTVVQGGEVEELYPVERIHDPHADELGKVPYTPEYWTALGTLLARRLEALRRPPVKVIALDCDHTLWRGVVAEDGASGIALDPPYLELQRFMVAQQEAGVLLVLVSKNHPDDVMAVFEERPEMVLRRDQLTSWEIGWSSKAEGLRTLAERLELGLDSFVFVDDNPVECAAVCAELPQVLTLRLPSQAAEIPRFLAHVWPFDRLQVTEEDRRRTLLYRQDLERRRFRRRSTDLASFLEGLELRVEIATPRDGDLPRLAQLVVRTNQFNASVRRRSEAELGRLLDGGELEALAVRVEDRFGDYGLVGLVLFHSAGDALEVDTLLLSCRVLGRGVEHRMLARLGEVAGERGLTTVVVPFVAADRNQPVLRFLHDAGGRAGETGRFVFDVDRVHAAGGASSPRSRSEASTHRFLVRASPSPGSADRGERKGEGEGVADSEMVEAIALTLRDPAEILRRVLELRQRQSGGGGEAVAPRTPIEEIVAGIFGEVLGIDEVGVHHNFFHLGGHSLLGTVVLSRLRDAFDVEIPLARLFAAPTVAALAALVEEELIGGLDGDEIGRELGELEELSDTEVRELLAQEGGGATA